MSGTTLHDRTPWDSSKTFGDVLLVPTTIYVRKILELHDKVSGGLEPWTGACSVHVVAVVEPGWSCTGQQPGLLARCRMGKAGGTARRNEWGPCRSLWH